MSNNWQKDIHDRMGNYEIDAPEGLWDNISKEMGSKEISSKGIGPKSMGEANGDNKQTTKGATIFQHRFQRAVGIAVAACLAFVVGFYFYNSDDTTPTLADNSASQKTVTKQQYINPISDNKDLLGYPKNYTLHVKDMIIQTGSEMIVILLNNIITMPGLPKVPNYENMN